jgi:hypothetical protein
MTSKQQKAIQAHVDAIPAILYADSNPEFLKTLEDIEITIRNQVVTHVIPRMGVFVSAQSAEVKRQCKDPSKYIGENMHN